MRTIEAKKISEAISELCIRANTVLRKDVLRALGVALKKEKNRRARKILEAIVQNALLAAREGLPICQDTGIATVFIKMGREVKVAGDLNKVVDQGVRAGYTRGYLRSSVVEDPVRRGAEVDNIPSVVHLKVTGGRKLKITVMPRGFGSENVSRLRMLRPTDGVDKIKEAVVEAVCLAGPDACPPFIIGVGIGGTAEKAVELSKEALILSLDHRNPRQHIAKLEKEILDAVNGLGMGPMGLGGRTTALGIKVLTYPTHIAGLPVAIHISCHALRSATAIL